MKYKFWIIGFLIILAGCKFMEFTGYQSDHPKVFCSDKKVTSASRLFVLPVHEKSYKGLSQGFEISNKSALKRLLRIKAAYHLDTAFLPYYRCVISFNGFSSSTFYTPKDFSIVEGGCSIYPQKIAENELHKLSEVMKPIRIHELNFATREDAIKGCNILKEHKIYIDSFTNSIHPKWYYFKGSSFLEYSRDTVTQKAGNFETYLMLFVGFETSQLGGREVKDSACFVEIFSNEPISNLKSDAKIVRCFEVFTDFRVLVLGESASVINELLKTKEVTFEIVQSSQH